MIEQVSIKSYNGVTSSTRTSVENSVNDFKSQIKCNKEFLEGLTIHTVIDSKYLEGNSVFTKYAKESHEYKKRTFTTSPAYNEGKKEIVLNVGTPLSGIWDINKSNSDTQQLLFHEIGHCFDEYFGSSDEELLEKVKQISFSFESLNKNEEDILIEFEYTKDLSDSDEFKTAWKEDIINYSETSLSKDIICTIPILNKFVDCVPFEYTPFEIDIRDGVSDEEVDQSDYARSEIFAQLFSYAMGKEDDNKEIITSTYEKTYILVKNYILKYLGIECN